MSEGESDERLWLKRSDEGGIEEVVTESEGRGGSGRAPGSDRPGEPCGESEVEEGPIWGGEPTLEAFFPFYLTGCLVGATGTITVLAFPLPLWVAGILVLFGAVIFASPLVFQRAWTFAVTEGEVRSEFRLFVRRSKSASFDKVTDVVASQDLVGSVFGFGTVRVDTAGTPFQGVRFWGIRTPFKTEKKVRGIVDEHKDEQR